MHRTRNIRRAMVIFAAFFICFNFFFSSKVFSEEEENGQDYSGVITRIDAQLYNGSGPATNVSQWQVFRLNAEFALDDYEIHEGDTTTITLPNELRFYQASGFEITDSAGNVVANAAINGSEKTITLTYTDYPETHSDVSGSFFFYVRVDRSQLDEEKDIPLYYDIDGKTLIGDTIHFVGFSNPTPRLLGKSGEQKGSGNRRDISYQLSVNTKKVSMKDVTITDNIESPGVTFKKDTLKIYKGNWESVKGDWAFINQEEVTDEYEVEWGEDGSSFSIYFGDIAEDEGYRIRYEATSDYDLVDGEVIRNKATITGSDIETVTSEGVVTYYMAGGSAEGYVYKIRIHKEDEEGNALAGAEFDIIRKSNSQKVGTITTDATGSGEITGLLKDSYSIVETKAPEGYVLSGETTDVDINDFDDEKVAVKTITNTAEPVTETSTETTEPTTESTEPTTESTEPTTESTEPTTESTEPTTESTEPITESTEPTTESTEPITESTEITTESSEETIGSAVTTTEPTSSQGEESVTGDTVPQVTSTEKLNSPQTGDAGNIFGYVLLGLLSTDVILILFIVKKIKN